MSGILMLNTLFNLNYNRRNALRITGFNLPTSSTVTPPCINSAPRPWSSDTSLRFGWNSIHDTILIVTHSTQQFIDLKLPIQLTSKLPETDFFRFFFFFHCLFLFPSLANNWTDQFTQIWVTSENEFSVSENW